MVLLDGGGMESREKAKGQGGAVRLGQPSLAAEEGASRRTRGLTVTQWVCHRGSLRRARNC